jgi:uncharacterized protein (TIGR02466 family)
MAIHTYPMFITPLWIDDFDAHLECQQSYIDYIEDTNREDHNSSFITSGELHNNTIFEPLVQYLTHISKELVNIWELETNMTQIGIQQMWGSCASPGGLLMPIMVPNAFVTGTYFVKTPPESGTLLIDNPNTNLDFYANMHRRDTNEFNVDKYETVMPEGSIALYPGNLRSIVTTNNNPTENRYVIHFSLALVS